MGTVMTVTGPMSSEELGFTSMHEHIYSDLTRDVWGPNNLQNNPELAFRELMHFKDAGGASLVDQTCGGLRGHDHDLLPVKHAVAIRQLAEKTGLNIILGAGWYREPYYEERVYRMKTDQIAEELVGELVEGIDGTDVRAGILGEIGAHFTWVSPAEERVFRAVGRAQKQTGVLVSTHALFSPVGLDQLDILEEEGVDLRRVVISHCQSYPHHEYHAEIARRGAFVQIDRLGLISDYERETEYRLIREILDAGLIRHLLFAQDVCRREDNVAYGGTGYAYLPGKLREDLRGLGMSDEEFDQITVENPKRALTGED